VSVAVIVVGSRDQRLEDLLRQSGPVSSISWTADFSALTGPQARQPNVLVVDLRRTPQLPSALATLKGQHPSTKVLLIATSLDPALILHGMRAGVNEVVAEPLVQNEIDAAMTRLLGHHAHAPAGPVVAFIGAKGGVGTTTTAVNVATALGKLSAARAILIDLHLAYGDAAVFLGADARFSVLDAIENFHRLDAAFLKSLVASTSSGLDLLASAERPAKDAVDIRRITSVIELAASQYGFTVIDVPRGDHQVLDNLDQVTSLVVIANQELATVRNAGRMAGALRARYPKAKVTTVINRIDRRAEIGHRDIERAVGSTITHQFPSDYRRALGAMHKGRPLALDNHNDLSASFMALAREIAGISQHSEAPPSSSRKGFLLGRR